MRRLTVSVLLVVVALTACGGGENTTGADEVRTHDGPVNLSSLADVCAGKARLTRAAPYSGPAPHPVTLFGPSQGNTPDAPPYQAKVLNVGPQFDDEFGAGPAETQLAGCLERVRETPTDVICSYILNDRVPFFRSSYRMTVREVRTGAVVGRFMIDPAAEGCPSEAKVNLLGPKVWSSPTFNQYVQGLQRYTQWDGQGQPPTIPPGAATPRNTGGRELTAGPARLTAPPNADAQTLAVLGDYLAFWSAYEGAREQRRPFTPELQAATDAKFMINLSSILSSSSQSGLPRGPVLLTPTIRTQAADSVTIDDCLDETGREYVENGQLTGELGTRRAVSLVMAPQGGRFVATDFADAPADLCPLDAG